MSPSPIHRNPLQRVLRGATWRASALVFLASLMAPQFAFGQTGVDDDRVSLPEGPGSIEGMGDNVEIDPNMGSMTYSVGITTPTGRNGMAPSLDLSYSSSAPSDVIGVGWSMEMPTITRLTSRGIPDYDRDDIFAYNGGTELVRVSSGDDRQIYRERFEKSFRRYTWMEPGDGTQGYFMVEEPDGSVGIYGALEDGTLVDGARSGADDLGTAIYHLVEKVDPYGNRVRYEYMQSGEGERALPSRITWMFHDGQPMYSAEFDYELRPDIISDCGAGYEETLSSRLQRVKVFHGDQMLREARITYQDTEAAGGFSRVERITKWGLGGEQGGLVDPLDHRFEYQQALGVECTGADCDTPQIYSMGSFSGGGSLTGGSVTLVDINGDGLPDVLDTSQNSAHVFSLNSLTTDDGINFAQNLDTTAESVEATGQTMRLGEKVQTFDVNGDGYSDLVDINTGTFLLNDPDRADWLDSNSAGLDVDQLRQVDFANARFFDYNGDKKIDVLISVGNTTQVLRNTGNGFEPETVEPIGVGFADANLQMADMNGDGMNDPVEINSGSQLSYKISLGNGRWSGQRTITLDEAIPTSERDLAELEDLNGDGLDDVVIVTGSQVKYALNRLDHFDKFVTINSTTLPDLPERTDGVRVLYADMNANGSEDIVWITSSGQVDYLELFPERPNLLSKVSNGLGAVQKVRYGTAAEHAARAARANEPWDLTLQTPLAVVDQVDIYEQITGNDDGSGIHDVVNYTYRDGFYDGIEKQMRGFQNVEAVRQEDDYQESFTQRFVYNLGKEDLYMNGLLEQTERQSADRIIDRTIYTFESCPLSEVPSESALQADGQFPIRFMCTTREERVVIEGMEDKAVTIATQNTYDGYGNVIKLEELGDVSDDSDDLTTETTFVTPSTRWLLNLPAQMSVYRDPAGDRTEERYYYDGEDFMGEELGVATHGFLSRQTMKADDATTLTTLRQRRDEFGNTVETIDANGSLDDATTHRRRYTFDEFGLFITRTELLLGDYALVRDSETNYDYQSTSLLTNWMVERAGSIETERSETRVVYDGLGRTLEIYREGDEDGKPSTAYQYEYDAPVSRVLELSRVEQNGAVERQSARCIDGLGRVTQIRGKEGSVVYVDGFNAFNKRGEVVESFQPYTSTSMECDTSLPEGVLSSSVYYDGTGRILRSVRPDAGIFGDASFSGFTYEPLVILAQDEHDNDEDSPFFDTPLVRQYDGRGRMTSLTRTLESGARTGMVMTMHYDNTGSFTGYTDDQGNRHEMSVDLAGRITQVKNPNIGDYQLEYDAASNLVKTIDPRGVEVLREYDGQNRILAIYDSADRDGTLIDYDYDVPSANCPAGTCGYMAGQLGSVSYPLGDYGRGEDLFGFDEFSRPVYIGRKFGSLTQWDTRREFDHTGRQIAVVYPDGTRMARAFDGMNRVVAIPGFIDKIEWDERELLASVEWPNRAKLSLVYDDMMRPERAEHRDGAGDVLAAFDYTRDRTGRLMARQRQSEVYDWFAGSNAYTYDAIYRLQSMTLDGAEEPAAAWSYDSLDRITSQTASSTALDLGDYAYDADSPQHLKSAGGIELEYDAMGHVTQRGDIGFEWDELRRLSSITRGDMSKTIFYTPEGSHVARFGTDSVELFGLEGFQSRDGITSIYTTLENQKMARRDLVDAPLAGFAASAERVTAADAWLAGQEAGEGFDVRQHLGAVAAQMLRDAEQTDVSLHIDDTQSIIAAVDEEGIATGARLYWSTGMEREGEGEVDIYGFNGQERESLSGMLHYKMRQYDQQLGRWMSFDPAFIRPNVENVVRMGESMTGYAMVSNDFINQVDPNGLGPFSGFGKKGGKNGGAKAGPDHSKRTIDPKQKSRDLDLTANVNIKAGNVRNGPNVDNKSNPPSANVVDLGKVSSSNNNSGNLSLASIKNYDPNKTDRQNIAELQKQTGLDSATSAQVYGAMKQNSMSPEQLSKQAEQRRKFNRNLKIGGLVGFLATGGIVGGIGAAIAGADNDANSGEVAEAEAAPTAQ